MFLAPLNEKTIQEASRIVSKGGVIAYPTDTVYGLGCDPFNESAVSRVIEVKGRSKGELPILASSMDVASRLGRFSQDSSDLARAFWPGPLTLVVESLQPFPEGISKHGTVGLRIPDRKDTIDLIRACGGSLVGTSANISGMPSAKTAPKVLENLEGMIDLVIDGGPCKYNIESTVVDVSKKDDCTVLRAGAIREEAIRKALLQFHPG